MEYIKSYEGIGSWIKKAVNYMNKPYDKHPFDGGEKAKKKPKQSNKNWEKRWNLIVDTSTGRDLFEEFYKIHYRTDYIRRSGMLLSSDFREIKAKFLGDFEFLDGFEKWINSYIERKKAEDAEQAKIKAELDHLYYILVSDWTQNKYVDKYEASPDRITGKVRFKYTFENNDTFEMCDNEIKVKGTTYTVGLIIRHKFISMINELIINKGGNRPSGKAGPSSKKVPSYGHPKSNLYNTLKDTVKQREAQLSKMPKNHPDRVALQNELENAKRKVAEMKKKYQFEHLKPFNFFK